MLNDICVSIIIRIVIIIVIIIQSCVSLRFTFLQNLLSNYCMPHIVLGLLFKLLCNFLALLYFRISSWSKIIHCSHTKMLSLKSMPWAPLAKVKCCLVRIQTQREMWQGKAVNTWILKLELLIHNKKEMLGADPGIGLERESGYIAEAWWYPKCLVGVRWQ